MTLVILGGDGQGAKHLRISGGLLALVLCAGTGAIAGALWIGWKIGELTALL